MAQDALWRAGDALRSAAGRDGTSSIHDGTGGGIVTGFSLSPPQDGPTGYTTRLCLLSPPPRCHPSLLPSPTETLGAAVSEAGGRPPNPGVFKASSPAFSGKPDQLPSTV